MKDVDTLMPWPRPKEEVLIYSLLKLRGCKTRAEVEKVCNAPSLKAWAYSEVIHELVQFLPSILANLAKIYGEEGE